MKDLQYEPIGKVKMSTAQKWRNKANQLEKVVYAVAVSMFIMGMICGNFIAMNI